MENVIQLEADYVLHTYNRAPFVLASGEGMFVTDTDGKQYLDFTSGIAVTALGHSHPAIVAAVQEQIATLSHVCNLYHTAPHAELAARLCELSFADKVYFCNSGGEAIEGAIKFARKYARTVHGPGKTELVAFRGGFHGRTAGALSITDREKYQAPFGPLVPGARFAPFNDIEAAQKIIGPETCAVFVEPVQGEGGVHLADAEFLRELRSLCDRWGALLVFDEIQTGLGRTGKLWAHDHVDVQPDMMALAKALGGGLPIGATLVTDAVAEVIHPGDHGSTFAAGPIACRVAQVVLDTVSQSTMLEHIQAMSTYLTDQLASLESPHIKKVRGLGLIVGLEVDADVFPIIDAGYEHGVMMLPAGPTVLRFLPALIVQQEHIDQLIDVLKEIL